MRNEEAAKSGGIFGFVIVGGITINGISWVKNGNGTFGEFGKANAGSELLLRQMEK